jgi:Zn-finger nucleic acid-binding protein
MGNKMKLIEVCKPTPKCPRCRVHLVKRAVPYFGFAYDCPKCQAVYREEDKKKNDK